MSESLDDVGGRFVVIREVLISRMLEEFVVMTKHVRRRLKELERLYDNGGDR